MRIQHNIAAQNSYRQLGGNNTALGKNLEKLSSGYKINRAGDDAAGLAISEKMRSQITGLKKAQDNANDGISLVQTAEGALTEVHSMLNRMVELADQSSNGTFDNETDRANLQKEVTSLKNEIDRISEGTNFNGIKLLDGSMGGAGSTGVTYNNVLKTVITDGNGEGGVNVSVSGLNEKDTITVNTSAAADVGVTKKFDSAGKKYDYTVTLQANKEYSQADIDKLLADSGVKLEISTDKIKTSTVNGEIGAKTAATAATQATTTVTVGTTAMTFESTVAGDRQNTVKVTFADDGAVGATVDKSGNIAISLDGKKNYSQDEINRMLEDSKANLKLTSGDIAKGTAPANANANLGNGTGAASLGGSLSLQVGDSAQSFNKVSVQVGDMSASSLGIADVDISTQDGARNAIAKINSAINSVSSTRGDLGAVQNRLEHTINNLGVTEENMSSAESRVRDTDMAKEMMQYTKNNILVQASQAMLAQANQLPQGVLKLLG